MSLVKLYGLKKCGTCAKAMAWLEQHGIDYRFTDYRDHSVPANVLTAWATDLGGWEKMVNRASMTWRNLPDERKSPVSPEQWLALIAEFPALIKRPVMVASNGAVSVGFSEKKYGALAIQQ
ncbi:MAG TPA: Spx/MgsR family RNA polymerase-binding regulatory protein [Paralcaligenes sp.]